MKKKKMMKFNRTRINQTMIVRSLILYTFLQIITTSIEKNIEKIDFMINI